MIIKILEDENWWGGAIHDGIEMPLNSASSYSINLWTESRGNQSSPLYISTQGRYIWSESPFRIRFANGEIFIDGDIVLGQTPEKTLKSAYLKAKCCFFDFERKLPEKEFFVNPQYNTWAELTYNQDQQHVLDYARNTLKNKFNPGVLIIDDTWQKDYGMWDFDAKRFPNPKDMVKELHEMGFKVMLWLVPYVSPDSPAFRDAEKNPARLIRKQTGEPLIIKWWNGYSAVLNMESEDDQFWLKSQTDWLEEEYGIDGFKFDGGNLEDFVPFTNSTIGEQLSGRAWHIFTGNNYVYHELKDTWKCGGRPYIQRLRDKLHSWGKDGLQSLIPDALTLSLTGHPYICPDMIGGGEWQCFHNVDYLDEELIVRFAQCSAFFPMMQFSVAPWRVLSQKNMKAVHRAQELHVLLGEEIYSLVKISAKTGEPIMRSLEYVFPHQGYEKNTDQFLLGSDILVAPILEKGKIGRYVTFPPGEWIDEEGNVYIGPQRIQITPSEYSFPWFRKKSIKLTNCK